MEEKKCCECSVRTKERGQEEYRALVNRLNRVEGQIRGIRSMVENSTYCTDILTQVMAARSALDAFCRELLSAHIKTCVVNDVREGKTETVDELVKTVERLIK